LARTIEVAQQCNFRPRGFFYPPVSRGGQSAGGNTAIGEIANLRCPNQGSMRKMPQNRLFQSKPNCVPRCCHSKTSSNFAKNCQISGNIWLEHFCHLPDSWSMNVGGEDANENAGRMATARADQSSTSEAKSDWLSRTTGTLRLGTILQVPVGYEDEAGFHCGEPQMEQTLPPADPPVIWRAEQL
jgi:hypothetical protein